MSLSPKDMDFVEAKDAAAREIALAFGVPPLLLGLPGDNTHANYAEANRAFYRQTSSRWCKRTAEAMVQWLQPAYGGRTRACEPDLDAIEALSTERESLWRRVVGRSVPQRRREARGGGLWTGRHVRVTARGMRIAALVPAAAAVHDLHHRQHHRHLDQHADDGRERRAGMEAEQADRGGDGELEEVAGADQRRRAGDAMLHAERAVEPDRRGRH